MKRRTLQLLLLVSIFSVSAMGQINCASGPASQKLVCEFPYAAGQLTNDTALGSLGSSSSGENAAKQAATFNSAVASQVSQLPLASASAGTVVVYKGGVPETFNNLGPILTDRASTIGKHRFFLGATASQFVFTSIDGISLGALPLSYVQTAYNSSGGFVSNTYTTEETKLRFKINQFIGVATYGLTDRVELSVIVPVEYVSFGATTYNSTSYIANANNGVVFGPYSNAQTWSPGTASGVSDITFNIKGEVWRGEHATVSTGFNFRTPTGDDLNYLGSGAWGFNPYVVYSYLWKVSPHAKLGYQWNTATELNNPIGTSGGNLALPGGMQYDLGADWAVAKRWTIAGDILGNQYLDSYKIVIPTTPSVTLTGASGSIPLFATGTQNSSYSISNVSAGLKANPFRDLVFSANVLFQLNDIGMRSRPTPLLGISYKF